MTSAERVKIALNHKESDRIPLDIGGTRVSGIHTRAYQKYRQGLGMPGHVRGEASTTGSQGIGQRNHPFSVQIGGVDDLREAEPGLRDATTRSTEVNAADRMKSDQSTMPGQAT